MYFEKASVRDYLFICIMILAIALSSSNLGLDSKWFNQSFLIGLGVILFRYIWAMYFMHSI